MNATIADALERYDLYVRARGGAESAIDHTKLCLRLFDAFLQSSKGLRDISSDDFRRFIVDLRQRPNRGARRGSPRPLSGASVNTYARGVKAFFSWLKAEGIIEINPLASEPAPKKPKTIPKVYSNEELEAFVLEIVRDPRNKAVFFFFLDSGMRLSEMARMDVDDVNTHEGSARVMGKGQKQRWVPIDGLASAAIEEYVRDHRSAVSDTARLFLTRSGRPLSAGGMQSMLDRAGKKAGIGERLAPHKLRHTFATRSLKHGGNLEYIRIILGHTDIKTTSDAYLNVDNSDIKEAHTEFSPLSNLMKGMNRDDEYGLLDQKRPTKANELNPESSNGMRDGKEASRGLMRPSDASGVLSERQATATGENEKGAAEQRCDVDLAHLKPTCRELYMEHRRKLAALVAKLVVDIDGHNLERHQPGAYAGQPRAFTRVDLASVYCAQNSQLWRFLSQHLDNEFVVPNLIKQISRLAADTFVAIAMKRPPSDPKLAAAVREKLILLSERGTFEGICDVCRNYFE